MQHVTRSRPFWGITRHLRLELGVASSSCTYIPTKLEVSISTRYKDIKGDTKCGKLGGLKLLGVVLDH